MLLCLLYSSVYVSTKADLGIGLLSWTSAPRNMPAMVTFGASSFLGWRIDSMSRSGVRKLIVKGEQMDDTLVSFEFEKYQCK